MFPRLSAFAFSRASSDRLTYAKSFRSAASRVTASASAAEDPVLEPLVESEAETSEPRVSEETSESEESFAPRASPRSVSLSLAESWPTMMSASDRPELAEPSNGEGDRFGDRTGGDPSETRALGEAAAAECPGCRDEGLTVVTRPGDARGSAGIPARHVGDRDPDPCDPCACASSEPCEEEPMCLFGRVGLAASPGGGERQAPASAPPPAGGPSMERTLRRSDAAAPASSSEEAASEAAREDGCSELA